MKLLSNTEEPDKTILTDLCLPDIHELKNICKILSSHSSEVDTMMRPGG